MYVFRYYLRIYAHEYVKRFTEFTSINLFLLQDSMCFFFALLHEQILVFALICATFITRICT